MTRGGLAGCPAKDPLARLWCFAEMRPVIVPVAEHLAAGTVLRDGTRNAA
jgi:hypothetical protein